MAEIICCEDCKYINECCREVVKSWGYQETVADRKLSFCSNGERMLKCDTDTIENSPVKLSEIVAANHE